MLLGLTQGAVVVCNGLNSHCAKHAELRQEELRRAELQRQEEGSWKVGLCQTIVDIVTVFLSRPQLFARLVSGSKKKRAALNSILACLRMRPEMPWVLKPPALDAEQAPSLM